MENIKHFIDTVSIGATIAALAGWLPAIAAFASLIWTLIRIYESATVQGWLRKGRE